MSLRTRLVLIVVGLLALGLFLAVGATSGALQDFKSGSDAGSTTELIDRTMLIAVISGVVALVAVALLAAWALGRGLTPLRRIAQDAREIDSGDLSRRVPDHPAGTEVGDLSASFNGMLDRLDTAFAERAAAEERLRRFVADASHELRTPIATIRGHAELFRRGAADNPADLAKVLSRIESEATRMGSLVDEMLLLARLDEGRPLEREPVDLVAVADDAVTDAQAADPEHKISLRGNESVLVRGDRARLLQVLTNLLTNVRTHTPPGTTAEVTVRRDGSDAVVEVADTGPGMTPDEQHRAFERFYRADAGRARHDGGSGLGLSIVQAVVAAHDGTVSMTSRPDEGTTVRVTLPAAPEESTPVR